MGLAYSYLFGSNENQEIDQATGLTARQKKIVQECWNIVESQALEIGVTIMIAFFNKFPQYQNEFPNFCGRKVEELMNDRKFHAHCLTIMSTIGQAIEFIHDAELCAAGLRMAGERHGRRGQETKAFELLEPIVNNIVKTLLGAKCTTEVSEAIDIAMALVFRELKHGIEEHVGKKNPIE